MNNFKKNIYRTTTEDTILPPSFEYSMKVGNYACIGGMYGISSFVFQTVYSNTSPIIVGSLLYDDNTLITPVTFIYAQLTSEGDKFIDVVDGEVITVWNVGSPC